MTVSISILSPEMEAHKTGCADIAKIIKRGGKHTSNSQSEQVYTGETALEAILAVDTDLADAFGETPYQDGMTHWTLATSAIKPCLNAVLKGLVQTGDRGQWSVAMAPIPGEKGYNPQSVTINAAHTCRCGCGGSPKGKRSRFLPGHDAKFASAVKNPSGKATNRRVGIAHPRINKSASRIGR